MEITMESKHSIKAVVNRTGISPYLIRAWERRYNAVTPDRTPTNRRLYTDRDIEKLTLLYKATLRGESIGQIANLSIKGIKELLGDGSLSDKPISYPSKHTVLEKKEIIDKYIELVKNLNREGLYRILFEAETSFSKPVLLSDIILPILDRIGDEWQDGSLKTVHEHLASAVLRSFLGELLLVNKSSETAPGILSTTLTGQLHEFGSIITTLSAIYEGWRGIYLGPNLPADEIASVTKQSGIKVIALSFVYPADDPLLSKEIQKLRRLVGHDVHIIAGGRMVINYAAKLEEINAYIANNIDSFRDILREIRTSSKRHNL